jgi:hypothetical protein
LKETMLGMQRIPEEYALPTLLGSSRQMQFWHEVERQPDAVVLAEMKFSKWTPAPVAKKKASKVEPQPLASTPEVKPKLHGGRPGSASKAQMLSGSRPASASKAQTLNGRRPRSASSPAKPKLSRADAEKEFMGAVCSDDLKKAEELLAAYGNSLLAGLSSHAIIHAARNNPKMSDLLSAHGAQIHKKGFSAQGWKQGSDIKVQGQVKPKASYMRETFVLGSGSSCNLAPCPHPDSHDKENQSVPHRQRSASVPNISPPMSVPKRSGSNTRARRQSIY